MHWIFACVSFSKQYAIHFCHRRYRVTILRGFVEKLQVWKLVGDWKQKIPFLYVTHQNLFSLTYSSRSDFSMKKVVPNVLSFSNHQNHHLPWPPLVFPSCFYHSSSLISVVLNNLYRDWWKFSFQKTIW